MRPPKCYIKGRTQKHLIEQAFVGFYGGKVHNVESNEVTRVSVAGWEKVRLRNMIDDAEIHLAQRETLCGGARVDEATWKKQSDLQICIDPGQLVWVSEN